MHVDLGGYHVRDIEFTAAFDIDATKVGKDLGQAIWAGQNNTMKFATGRERVPKKLGVPVYRGMTHDGLGKYLKEKIKKAPGETADIVKILKDTHTDVVVSYLPVGSEQATKWYVEQVLEAGCGFVNCIPVFIAREDYWDKRFKKAGLPIVGDDIKSQVGATIVHRTLARLFADRGVKMLRTSQLNVGGNMDFYNMLERERLESKKISKTNAVTSIMDHELPPEDVLHRSLGLRAVADRPQVGAHPRRGPGLRRRAAERRDEARGVGLAQLGRDRDRRRALLQARAQPRRRRPARRALLLPDEVAPQPAPRQPGARGRPRSSSPSTPARQQALGQAGHRRRQDGQRQARSQGDAEARDNGGADGISARFSIAHVTPYPWEAQENEVNAYVERVASELSERGHRVLILAPSRSQERVRASRRELRAARAQRRGRSSAGGHRRRRAARDRGRRGARPAEHADSRPVRAAGARRRCRSTWRARSRNC